MKVTATMRALTISASATPCSFFLLLVTILFFPSGGDAQGDEPVTFDIRNKCPFPIWPATMPKTGHPVIAGGGFLLPSGSFRRFRTPPSWNGRLWARTGCVFDSERRLGCRTGDCKGILQCSTPGRPPATLVEVNLQADKVGEPSYYSVSLLDGYNLPVSVAARPSQPKCLIAGCRRSPNADCPADMQVVGDENDGGEVVMACKSACLAYDQDKYCCRNEFATPETCRPSSCSRAFKAACPSYISYAFDTHTTLRACDTREFVFTFCPSEWSSE